MPGDKQDISEFLESAISNTQLHFDLTVPHVDVFLPDRDLFEVLYNRSVTLAFHSRRLSTN